MNRIKSFCARTSAGGMQRRRVGSDPGPGIPGKMLWLALVLSLMTSQACAGRQIFGGEPLTITGVGDIMLGTNYPSESYLPPEKKCLLDPVSEFLRDSDVTFGNLEGAILSRGGTPKRCGDPSKCYAFRMPPSCVNCLKEAGFDLLSLANNHSGDFGAAGRKNTIRLLDSHGMESAGLLTKQTAIFEKDGVKYGFCAFAPNIGTCDIRDIPAAKRIVRKLEKDCDIVIVSFHGGAEGAKHQHVPRRSEKYYGENRGDVHKFAHAVIDAGADVVFGHGPHVIRAAEIYKGRFIIYSLGNFCTYGRFNLRGPNGIAPIVKLRVRRDGSFVDGKIISTVQLRRGGPFVDPRKRALSKLRSLTKEDFPKTGPVFDEQGNISRP